MRRIALAVFLTLAAPAMAQTAMNFGTITADPNAPVEVDAASLSVDQSTGRAVFSGDVTVGQGDLRLGAERIEITYDDTGEITLMTASGGVTFATPTEAAEAQNAVYDLRAGSLVLTGEVLVTQSGNAISAGRMEVDLASGDAVLTGRVRTVFGGGQ